MKKKEKERQCERAKRMNEKRNIFKKNNCGRKRKSAKERKNERDEGKRAVWSGRDKKQQFFFCGNVLKLFKAISRKNFLPYRSVFLFRDRAAICHHCNFYACSGQASPHTDHAATKMMSL